ncbi:hypothetical protein AHAS_Ahas03G0129400 [Arachis hypogaea]
MAKEVMKTLNEDIRTISGILVEHGKILQSLIVAVGPLANLKKEALEGNARMVECRKTQAKATDPPEATMVSKKAVGAKRGAIKISPPLKPTTRGDTARQRKTQKNRNSGPTKSAKLKCKLTFKDQDCVSTEGSHVRQTEHGSLFTYHTHPAFHVASEMPHISNLLGCLELAFRPPEGMHFQGSEFAVAAYIFSKNLDEREILVADEHAQGDRRALWSLRPGQQVVDDKIALSPVNHNIDTFEFIWSNFMGYADNLHQIYVPMYREQHWYLMIVDLVFCRLIYLDFAKNASEYEARIAQMKYVMNLLHREYVARYEDVTNQTRMWLALDLFMGRHNPIAHEVARRAMADWERYMSHSKRRHNGNHAPADASPSSSDILTF